jgi:hypothetical protein
MKGIYDNGKTSESIKTRNSLITKNTVWRMLFHGVCLFHEQFPAKKNWGMKLTTYANLVLRLRMIGVTSPLPHMSFGTCTGTILLSLLRTVLIAVFCKTKTCHQSRQLQKPSVESFRFGNQCYR